MAVRQPAGTALVQEVDVFNEQAEERDDDLEDQQDTDGVIDRSGWEKSFSSFRGTFWGTLSIICDPGPQPG